MVLRGLRLLAACVGLSWSYVASAGVIEFDFSPPLLERIEARGKAKRTLLTVPACQAAPKVDGDGGDAAWASAAQIGQLARGGSMNTTVRLCHDGQTLYILAACKERPGRTPKAKEDTRDGRVWDDDCIELRIETLAKNTPQYAFIVNIAGVLYDAAGPDAFYNPDWSAVVKRGESQWTLEAAIPAAAVGLRQWQREIGFNIGRNVPGVGNQSWNPSWQDASSSRLALEGAPEAGADEEKELVSSPNVAASGSSLRIRLDRPYARPAERWIEATLQLKPKAALAQTRLDVKLFPLAKTEPVEKLSVTPTGAHAALRVDLRSAKLEKGEVALELFEGNERTGAVKAFVSAQSETPVKAGWKIAVTLDAPEGVGGLKDWPVTFGVPFAAGTLWDAKQLRLVNKSGREIPCQKEVTGRWARDGAIQWVRFDALVTPEDGCFVEVAEPSAPSTPLRVTEDGQGVTVDTGTARYVLGKGASPIREVWLAGRKVASSDGTRGLYVVDQTGKLASASADGETMAVEARGPVAACVRFEGFYRTSDGQELARHITRVECFAGQPAASITHTLVLTNDTNKVWFKEIGWEFAVSPGASPEALFGLSPDQHEKRLSIPLSDAAKSACMLQDSHYVFAHGKDHFSVAVGGATRHEGEECGDWAALVGRDAGLQMVCREAARQHPKEFEVFGNRMVLKLFSNRAGEELDFRTPSLVKRWDLETWVKKAAREQEQKEEGYVAKVAQYNSNAVGWSRTHQLLVNPLPAGNAAETAARASRLHRQPLLALVDPWWIYESQAMGPLYPKDPKRFPEVERAQEAAFQWWIDTDRKWGENGFVDYFAGPHLCYVGDYAEAFRYCQCTYTLRTNIWRVYARSGSRAVREFCEGTTRGYMDNLHMHWDPPPGSDLVRGLYRASMHYGLPFYWGERGDPEISSSTNFHNYLWMYHLTGYRRAKEVVEQYAQGIKQFWTPQDAKRTSRILMLMRLLAQCYQATGDPELRELAEATTDLFEDREGDLLLTKERPYNSSSYKTQVDIRALIDAWHILGSPRYRELAMTISEFWWTKELGTNGFGYNIPMAVIGNFLHSQTGEPRYAQAMAVSVRHLAATFDSKTGAFPPRCVDGAHSTSFIFELDTALDVLARSGADKNTVSSWLGYGDAGGEATVVVQKPDKGAADLHFQAPPTLVPPNLPGATAGVRVRPVNPKGGWGQDLTRVIETSSGTGVVHVPKDAPSGAYQVFFPQQGDHFLFANAKLPLVLHAPGYWIPAPPQVSAVRYYFSLPKESQDAQIFFEGQARLFDPKGAPFGPASGIKGWVSLPADRHGLWAFEPIERKTVRVRNLPPFFAAGDPSCYFTPDIAWAREAVPEPPKAISADILYVPGAIATEGNQALHLTGPRCLEISPGPDHPSGDGSLFLPHKQATIEFFMQPTWDSVELSEGKRALCFGRMKEPGGSNYYTLDYLCDKKQVFAFLRERQKDGRGVGVRTSRNQTLFERGKWVHVAWVWGKATAVYIDGKLGDQRPSALEGPPFSPLNVFMIGYIRPEQNINAMVDELRISDIARYTAEFTPPSRDVELRPDKHTRLLMHFNGNLDAESYGHTGPAPVKLTK